MESCGDSGGTETIHTRTNRLGSGAVFQPDAKKRPNARDLPKWLPWDYINLEPDPLLSGKTFTLG
jgi:hypothetical protein